MRIVIVNSSLALGGAEAMSVELANALASAGHDVALAGADGPLRANLAGGVEFLPTSNLNHSPVRGALDLVRHFRRYRPEVVHSHGGIASAVAAAASWFCGQHPARVVTHHSRRFWRSPRLSGALIRLAGEHFVAISASKRDSLERAGIPPERISLIPNFVDTAAIRARVDAVDRDEVRRGLGAGVDDYVVCVAGRAVPAKRFDRFARIVAAAAPRLDRPLHGVALGDGPALEDARSTAREVGAGGFVHFLGYQSDVQRYLGASDAALFPSEHPEVLPMFLIESLSAGVPVVCSDIPGNRDVVDDGETGVVVSGDDDAFAAALAALLADGHRRRRMAAAARERSRERYDTSRVVAKTVELYESLLSRRGSRHNRKKETP